MEFRCLGPIGAMFDGVPVDLGEPQRRLVLALLLARANSVVSTDLLMDGIWGDVPPENGRKIVQGYVSGLRKVLGADAIESTGPGYRLNVKPDQVDALLFEDLLNQAMAESWNEPDEAGAKLERALSLWNGEPYEDLTNFDALRPEITRLEQLRLTAIESKIEAEILSGDARGSTAELAELTRRFPLRERLWSLRMLVLYRTGRQAEALRVFEEARVTLANEIGIEPSNELRLLEQRILDQDPILDTPAALHPSPAGTNRADRNPYKGLRPFTEEDAEDFFGRSRLVRRLREMLDRRNIARLVVLAGPSGSGKSSVVGAGLVPKLRQEGWTIAKMFPGSDPVESLQSASARLDQQPKSILVVDQLEESITLASEASRDLFLDSLASMATRIDGPWVLVAVRADFLDRLLQHPRFAGLVESGLLLITPLDDHEIRDAIVEPASRVGLVVEPDLIAAMVSEVRDRASALPLLQYVLADLYDRAGPGSLTLKDLQSAGGISGGLVKRAEAIYEGLDEAGRATVRQLFLRLVTVTPEGEALRRRVSSDSLAGFRDVAAILDTLGNHRLISFDRDPNGQPTVEVAHEALLREWPRLAGWIEDARDSLRLLQQLTDASIEWEANGRVPTYLLTGPRLARYAEWAGSDLKLSESEDEFLTASRQKAQDELAQRRRRRIAVMAGLGSAAIIASVLAGVALNARNDSKHNEALATSRELAASAVSVLDEDPELSTLLALQAIESAPGDGLLSAAGVLALRTAIQENRLVMRIPGDFDDIEIAPDGSTIFVSSQQDRTVKALDSSTGAVTWTFEDPSVKKAVWSFAFVHILALSVSPDGSMVAISIPDLPDVDEQTPPLGAVKNGRAPGMVVVLDAQTGEEIRTLIFEECRLSGSQLGGFTADGKWLAVTTGSENCFEDPEATWTQLYDPLTWKEGPRIRVEGMSVENASFSPDGSLVLVQDFATKNAELRSFPDLELINQLEAGQTWPLMGPDLQVVSESPEISRRLLLVDALHGDRNGFLDVDDFTTTKPAFSADGSVIAVGTRTNDYVFDANSGRLLVNLGNTGTTNGLDITADGDLLVTINSAGVEIWDISSGANAAGTPLTIPGGEVIWLNPNVVVEGQDLAVGVIVDDGPSDAEDATMTLILDPETGSTIDVVPGDSLQLDDGRFVAALRSLGSDNRPVGPLVVLDPRSASTVELDGCVAPLEALVTGAAIDCPSPFFSWYAFDRRSLILSPDGSYFAATSYAPTGSDRTVRVWDAKTLEIQNEFQVPYSQQAFAAGASWLATISNTDLTADTKITVYDPNSGTIVNEFEGPSSEAFPDAVNAITGDGSLLLLADANGVVVAFDTTSWEEVARWRAHDAVLRGFAISPDGDRLATTGQDDLVKVWDISGLVEDGSLVGAPPLLDRFPAHFPSDAAWLSSNELGVSLTDPAQYIKVSLNVEELVAEAAQQLTRSFSIAECTLYQIDPCPTLDEIRER